jgi:hypothetical protein
MSNMFLALFAIVSITSCSIVNALSPTLTSSTAPTYRQLKRTKSPSASPSIRPSLPPSFSDPKLQSFGLDCSTGRLDLYFDSLISAPSLNIPKSLPSFYGYIGIFLFRHLLPVPVHPKQQISSKNSSNSNNTLFSMTAPFTKQSDLLKQGNTTQLILYLSADDFANLALTLRLSKSPPNSYVYLSMDAGKYWI